MKYFLIVFLIVGMFAVHVSGQPNQAASNENKSAKGEAPAPSSSITKSYYESEKNPNHSDNQPPHWYASLKGPEWWLVIVGILTLFAIVYQSREMARATKAMQRSTDLQEIQLRQWVEFHEWKAVFAEGGLLRVKVHLVNPTSFPLTVHEGRVVFGHKNPITCLVAPGYFLPPRAPYVIAVEIPMTGEEVRRFNEAALRIRVEGAISHSGTLGKGKGATQSLVGYLRCGWKSCNFELESGMNPEHGGEKENQDVS
jgi:hypothetical protein